MCWLSETRERMNEKKRRRCVCSYRRALASSEEYTIFVLMTWLEWTKFVWRRNAQVCKAKQNKKHKTTKQSKCKCQSSGKVTANGNSIAIEHYFTYTTNGFGRRVNHLPEQNSCIFICEKVTKNSRTSWLNLIIKVHKSWFLLHLLLPDSNEFHPRRTSERVDTIQIPIAYPVYLVLLSRCNVRALGCIYAFLHYIFESFFFLKTNERLYSWHTHTHTCEAQSACCNISHRFHFLCCVLFSGKEVYICFSQTHSAIKKYTTKQNENNRSSSSK